MKKPTDLQLLQSKISSLRWQGITQQKIAKDIGITPEYLSMVLNAKKPVTGVLLDYINRRCK